MNSIFDEKKLYLFFVAIMSVATRKNREFKFSFDKIQDAFADAIASFPDRKPNDLLSAFESKDADGFSARIDNYLGFAEHSRWIYSNGGNRNKFQVACKADTCVGRAVEANGEIVTSFGNALANEFARMEKGRNL